MSLQLTRDGAVLHIQLDRPASRNAIDAPMRDALYEAFLYVQDDATIHAVVLSGNGKGFCAGADLQEFSDELSVLKKRRIRQQHDVWELIRSCPKLTIVAMHGFAVGSGIELAMLCDIRFATATTIFALPEVSIGMMPAAGGTQSLPRATSLAKALHLALTAERFDAQQAYRWGIIQEVCENVVEEAMSYAHRATAHPQHIQLMKHQLLYR